MTQEKIKRIHLIYGIVLSVLLVAVAISLIVACFLIYNHGDSPFTRERIAEYWQYVCIPVYVCIAAIIGAFVLRIALPIKEEKTVKGEIDPKLTLARLYRRFDASACRPALLETIRKQRLFRTVVKAVSAVLCVACFAVSTVFLFLPNHIGTDMTTDLLTLLFVVCSVMDAMLVCFAASMLEKMSLRAETQALKLALSQGASLPTPREESEQERAWAKWGKGVAKVFAATASALGAILFIMIVMFACGYTVSDHLVGVIFLSAYAVVLMALVYALYFGIFADRPENQWKPRVLLLVRILILALALTFILLGVFNGGMRDVLQKAIRICSECIGIG
ncbi:MAG: hypothetical protein IJW71_06980 [Clostridia bacterium]|nr:hypothetical protein [Clostridia bacterium]MBQ9804939.1 hypothetical protein [Clostridia bacterium]